MNSLFTYSKLSKNIDVFFSLALDKEFELSALKFSRNYEISALINKLNMGFAAESNLVWSGQMPRSLSGNLTVDLFGQAINLMDFGARMEGLEYLVKNLFGSYLSEEERTATDKVSICINSNLFFE